MKVERATIAANKSFDLSNSGDDIQDTLKEAWNEASIGLKSSATWWNRLFPLQAEDPRRHYHTVVHLYEMIVHFQHSRHGLSKQDAQAILLAIFFHDAIYNAQASDNEEQSNILFETTAFDDDQSALKSKVSSMILATKTHNATNAEDHAIKLLLDLDMAVLGKDPDAYLAYASLIRKEYQHVDQEVYCSKRAEILQAFLDNTDHIFATDLFRDLYEAKARENLRNEIEVLQAGKIPCWT